MRFNKIIFIGVALIVIGSESSRTKASTAPLVGGFLDTSFKNSSSYIPGTVWIPFYIAGEGPLDACAAMAVENSSGNIVLAGTTQVDTFNRFAIARFLPSGLLDPSLKNHAGQPTNNIAWDGTNYIPFNIAQTVGISTATCVALQADGKTVVGGYSGDSGGGDNRFSIARFATDGTLDISFNSSGTHPGTNFVNFSIVGGAPTATGDQATCIAIDPATGNIYLGGWSTTTGSVEKRFALACFTSDGLLNTKGFNKNGARPGTTFIDGSITGGGTDDKAYALTIASVNSKKLLFLGGYSANGAGDNRFAYAVFNTDGTPNADFNGVAQYSLDYSIAGAAGGDGDDQINSLQVAVTTTATDLSLYDLLDVPLFKYAFEAAFEIVSLTGANTAASVSGYGFTFAGAFTLRYPTVSAKGYSLDTSKFATTFVEKLRQEASPSLDRDSQSFKELVADALSEAFLKSSSAKGKTISFQVYNLARAINSNTLRDTPPTILLQAGGFSKGAGDHYRFAVAQFTNQAGAIFGQEVPKNGTAYVPFSIAGRTGTADDSVLGIVTAGANADLILGGGTNATDGSFHFGCADFLSSGILNLDFGNPARPVLAGTNYIAGSIINAPAANTDDRATCVGRASGGLAFYLGGTSKNTATAVSYFALAKYRLA